MPIVLQIALGSILLVICVFSHIAVMAWIVQKLRAHEDSLKEATIRQTFMISSVVVLLLLFSHTLHIYLWAFFYWVSGALPGHEEAIYFSLVTYTTVGYGDVTIGSGFRIFAAMASVNGILAFGVTTAFLVGLFSKFLLELQEN